MEITNHPIIKWKMKNKVKFNFFLRLKSSILSSLTDFQSKLFLSLYFSCFYIEGLIVYLRSEL